MTLNELDSYFNSFLKKEDFPGDPSLNGIQIQNSAPDTKQIKKVAFAVDACEATVKLAVKEEADVLFVHHGIFWGHCEKITGSHYKRVAPFIQNDIALCAYHLPLDANNPYGNNYGLAAKLGLTNLNPFGSWKGMTIGVYGELSKALNIEEIAEKLMRNDKKPNVILPFGKKEIKTVGIISGGAGEDVDQASALGLDLYISGEISHEQYHLAKELCINVIGGGHYETEIIGVNLVAEKLKSEKDIETVFIDLPTGL